MNDFTTVISVEQSPAEVFAAVTNVDKWWSRKITGGTKQAGDEFTYRYKDLHFSKQKLTEVVPNKKVVWLVTEAQLNFTKDKTEWNGTEISFEIAPKGKKTELRFTHHGLTEARECFKECSNAWGFYVNDSLRSLITTGEGKPD